MIEIEVSEDTLNKSKSKAEDLGELKNSIEKGQGNLSGFIGEYIVAEYTGGKVDNTFDYDIRLSDGTTIDVKTKRTSYKPKEYYECSVAAFNTSQKCDYYCFVRVLNDYSKAWILGFYRKDNYFSDAEFKEKGQVDPTNNFTFKADCYNMKISELTDELQ